jgi:pimeloyl-ACP methyl ester carboxylesterase
MLSSWIGWREQIFFLAKMGYRVLVPSLRGFGETVNDYFYYDLYHFKILT